MGVRSSALNEQAIYLEQLEELLKGTANITCQIDGDSSSRDAARRAQKDMIISVIIRHHHQNRMLLFGIT